MENYYAVILLAGCCGAPLVLLGVRALASTLKQRQSGRTGTNRIVDGSAHLLEDTLQAREGAEDDAERTPTRTT